MEKQRITGTTGSFKRLLSLIFVTFLFIYCNLFCNFLFCQDYSDFQADNDDSFLGDSEDFFEYSKKLKEDSINKIISGEYSLSPVEDQDLFTNNEIKFELIIPGFKPSEIKMIDNKNLYTDSAASFVSLKKYEDNTDDGTKLQVWYKFDEKGKYDLLPLIANFDGRECLINFDSINIIEDPSKMAPEIVIEFSNGITIAGSDSVNNPVFYASVGKPLDFTIYVQYAAKLDKFNYNIPKDSIFLETKTFEIVNGNVKGLKTPSVNLIPVASFRWTVPEEGVHSLPFFNITATGYNGSKSKLSLPDIKIEYFKTNKNQINNDSSLDDIFNDSFIDSSDSDLYYDDSVKTDISQEECEKLAGLYSKERNSLFSYFGVKKERKSFEEELGLPVGKSPASAWFIFIGIITVVGGIVLLIFAIKHKHFFRAGVAAVVIASAISLLCVTSIRRSKNYGISRGCTIYSIPENNAEARCQISPGGLVLISETTDIWYYVQQGEASGWTPKDNIIVIK